MLISNQDEFESFVERAASSDVLALDTEFMREKNYYPKLCLLQLATRNEIVLVDPFKVRKLAPLSTLLENECITKVFHAGSQDLDILLHETGSLPRPLFDTQIAAALLGYSYQIGYGALVQSLCGIGLRKSDSFTDWSARPLARSQLEYAKEDVAYLPRIYDLMRKELHKLGRLHWLDEDFDMLSSKERYQDPPEERFRKLKRINQLSKKQLAAARELAMWREEVAKERNMPRKWVLSDEQVVEACRREARTIDQLYMVRGISEKLGTRDARDVVNAIRTGLDSPRDAWPTLENQAKNERNVDAEVDALSAIVRMRAKESNIAFHALATASDLTLVARGYGNAEILKGWRRKIAGEDLLAFMDGSLSLEFKDGTLKITSGE